MAGELDISDHEKDNPVSPISPRISRRKNNINHSHIGNLNSAKKKYKKKIIRAREDFENRSAIRASRLGKLQSLLHKV